MRGTIIACGIVYTPPIVDFRHIAIEGPIAVGKCALTERLAARLDAAVLLDDTENPFLADFYAGRPGAAFQAQLFSLLARHRQQVGLRQSDLFNRLTISDYLFDKDKIYAYLNLDDNELFIYQRLFDLLAPDVVTPDLVIYLQTPTDLLQRRARAQGQDGAAEIGAGRPLSGRVERGLSPLLLPLHGDAVARGGDVRVRPRVGRRASSTIS